ncbi:MAG: hypothetical protein J3Q66DRAFT_331951 [Benniella sp.]|nr:MAG: hypothetical protein J3Q66DRAFT_331951 [Benniella sp.]
MDKSVQKQHPLHLPEVIFRVVSYLDPKDALVCSLVSRAFYSSFAPYIWGSLHIGLYPYQRTALLRQNAFARCISVKSRSTNGQEQVQPSEEKSLLQVLQRAAPWIRTLSIHKHYSTRQLEFGENCTMLESLSIEGPPMNDKFDTTYWDNCSALVRRNSAHLRSLTVICRDHWGEPKEPTWTPISDCMQHKNLCSLRLQGGSIKEEQWPSYWKVFENLESLKLEFIYVVPPPFISNENCSSSGTTSRDKLSTARLPKLRTLTLNQLVKTEPSCQLDFICVCPMLHTLEWTIGQMTFAPVPVERFAHHFVKMAWPELNAITIKGHFALYDNVNIKDYISMLQVAQRPFRVLDIGIERFGLDVFDLLRQGHFKTLTKVDLSSAIVEDDEAVGVPQWVQEVLTSCPFLECVVARAISAQDIADGQPWVCLGLKEFRVMINMEFKKSNRGPERPKLTETQQGLCRAVYRQLGRLEQLRVLDMRRLDWDLHMMRYAPLPLELRLGLGELSRLKDIEMIGFHRYQDMRKADVEWMLQQWPYLSAIYGKYLSNKPSRTFGGEYVRNHLLMRMLESRGVEFERDEDRTKDKAVLVVPKGCVVYDTESGSESGGEGESDSDSDSDSLDAETLSEGEWAIDSEPEWEDEWEDENGSENESDWETESGSESKVEDSETED